MGRPIDAKEELLLLAFAEMSLRYYAHSAQLEHGPDAAAQVREQLVQAWAMGSFQEACASYASIYGPFDVTGLFFIGEGSMYPDRKDYESRVYAAIEADVNEALVPNGTSPLKAALETLRALRDILRSAVEFKGLTLSSHLYFQSCLQGRLARPGVDCRPCRLEAYGAHPRSAFSPRLNGGTPCSDNGPTTRPWVAQISASVGRAARVAFQLPGADVQSESCNSTVAPLTSVDETSSTIDSTLAPTRQSRPQVVHSTGRNPARRAAMSVGHERAP
jgi:hypothetical protein